MNNLKINNILYFTTNQLNKNRMNMRSEDILFEMKPCAECQHNCVETQPGVKCPYDKIAEDLIYEEEWEYIKSRLEKDQE